jgi:hypothetical protein
MHKFGIEIPKNVADAIRLDKEIGNSLWMDAITLEMSAVKVSFKTLPDGDDAPIGYQRINCHIIFDIFDVKLDGRRRSRD